MSTDAESAPRGSATPRPARPASRDRPGRQTSPEPPRIPTDRPHPDVTAGRRRAFRVRARVDAGILGRSHVALWLGVVFAVFAVGSAGYVALFHWSLSDAMYMTVITLTSVGYKEVRDLDDLGRAWTSVLSLAGVGIIFGTIGIVVESFVRESTSGHQEEQRMQQTIAGLHDHFVLCGYGRVGSTVAAELVERGHRVVVIDMRPESLERARRDGHLVVNGDAAEDATLRSAGIERAHGLVTTLDTDANNVYVILSARAMQPDLFILGRANAAGSEAKLQQAGANRVVSPYTMAGRRIAELATRPTLADFIDLALSTGEEAFSLEELQVVPNGALDGRSVGQLRAMGIFILAILPEGGRYQANPADDQRLSAGERLVLSGSADRLREVRPN